VNQLAFHRWARGIQCTSGGWDMTWWEGALARDDGGTCAYPGSRPMNWPPTGELGNDLVSGGLRSRWWRHRACLGSRPM